MSKQKETYIQKEENELKKILAEKREALRDFRFSMKGSRVRDTKAGSALRKDIARILTAISQKQKTQSTE